MDETIQQFEVTKVGNGFILKIVTGEQQRFFVENTVDNIRRRVEKVLDSFSLAPPPKAKVVARPVPEDDEDM